MSQLSKLLSKIKIKKINHMDTTAEDKQLNEELAAQISRIMEDGGQSAGIQIALYHGQRLKANITSEDPYIAIPQILKFAKSSLETLQSIQRGQNAEHTIYFYLCDIETSEICLNKYIKIMMQHNNIPLPSAEGYDFTTRDIIKFDSELQQWLSKADELYTAIRQLVKTNDLSRIGELSNLLVLHAHKILSFKVWIDDNMPTQSYG